MENWYLKKHKKTVRNLSTSCCSRGQLLHDILYSPGFLCWKVFFFLFKYPRKGIDFSDVMRSFSLLVPNSRWLWFIISECVCVWRQVTQNTRSGSQSPLFNFRRLVSAVCPPLFYSGKKNLGNQLPNRLSTSKESKKKDFFFLGGNVIEYKRKKKKIS